MNSFSTMQDLVTAFDKLHVSQLRDPRPAALPHSQILWSAPPAPARIVECPRCIGMGQRHPEAQRHAGGRLLISAPDHAE
jgi:hypothetical protein